ncbi:MAG: hypothetical protein AB7U29_01905 [Desulfobulbus sp.]
MSTQQIPPFTREALALLFATDNFQAFQKPGFPSHYWAPLLAACCGASRNEVFFLFPEDLVQRQGLWLLCLRRIGTKEAPTREVPVHPWLHRLGFVEFVQECWAQKPNERLFTEYKAGRENGGMPFSRAFVQWIKTTVVAPPVEQQQLFAEDFHFPSLRALFRHEAEQAGVSSQTLQLLQDGTGDLTRAASEVASIPIESCFPALPPFSVMGGKSTE